MTCRGIAFLAVSGLVLATSLPGAQTTIPGGREDQWDGEIVRTEGNVYINENTVRTAREVVSHSTGTPEWTNPRGFEKDVFTFARVIFKSAAKPGEGTNFGWGRGPKLGWWVDFPDADLNFSYRLQQMTSIRTDPDGLVIRLTDPKLMYYPLLMMEHAGYINLRDQEVTALSKYLRNGGMLWLQDFWSTRDWEGFEEQMRRVLPDRTWTELSMDHPLFHSVYKIEGPMSRLQVPTIQFWNQDHDPANPNSQLQTVFRGPGSETMRVRAWLDDRQRIMALAIHNSDLGDGWEREGENNEYFLRFSEKVAYPLGINIIFYSMTH